MRFIRQEIAGYPFYRVEPQQTGAEIVVFGWVERDSLGDGWWSYREPPGVARMRHLYGTRREAAEALINYMLVAREVEMK